MKNGDKPKIGSGYSEQGRDEGSCVLEDAKQPKKESISHACMCLFAHPTVCIVPPFFFCTQILGTKVDAESHGL